MMKIVIVLLIFASLVVVSLSRNISLYDKTLLPGKIGKILISTWSVRLFPGSDWSSTLVGV